MSGVPNPEVEKLIEEAIRITDTARENKVVLRIFGATAIRQHCPRYGYLQDLLGRKIGDIDFVTYGKHVSKVVEIMATLGFVEDVTVTAFGGGRLVFRRGDGTHSDVFVDKLEMSHVISFNKRLEVDYPTLPLAELLLAKMQIFKLNEKDIIDTMTLVREHDVGQGDKETVNSEYVSGLCASDWGLWRTFTTNVGKVLSYLQVYKTLSDSDRLDIQTKLDKLLQGIESHPKTLAWKLRARVGESRKWYNDVEELYR